jgi:hypothetical protein
MVNPLLPEPLQGNKQASSFLFFCVFQFFNGSADISFQAIALA